MAKRTISLGEAIRNSALIKNPVLFEAVGIAPVVAMAVSVKTSIMLAVISTVELIIIECFACLLLKKLKHSFRVLIYAVLGVIINAPLWLFFNHFAPNEAAGVGIFLPIIAVNSLIALHCERVAVKQNLKFTFVDAVSASIGYGVVIFIVGIIREIFGSGTFYSIELNLPVKFPGFLFPFGGFLMLGFTAALFKAIIKKKYPDEKPEAAFNMSEISDTHFDLNAEFGDEGFNPFDEFIKSEAEENTPSSTDKPKKEKSEKTPKKKKEKVKKEKTERKEKIQKAEKSADRKPKKEKIKKSEEAPFEIKKPESEKTTRTRGYQSEFDDLLADIENDKKRASESKVSDSTEGGDSE